MANLFSRVKETVKNLAPQDELDKAISSLVERGTNENLLGPCWDTQFQLVDLVNRSEPEVVSEKVVRIINKAYGSKNTKVQLLALQMLDCCMRNCHPMLHIQFALSVMWSDLLRQVQDTSVSRIDLEVRDKILGMIEDYGKWLQQPPVFREAYESLLEQGTDFPVRSAEEMAPIEAYHPPNPVMGGGPADSTPPLPPSSTPGGAPGQHGSGAANRVAEFFQGLNLGGTTTVGVAAGAGAAARGGRGGAPRQQRQPAVDPFAGMSEEDKAAVQAAMAEMEFEDESAREAAAVAAAADAAERQAAHVAGHPGVPAEAAAPGVAVGVPAIPPLHVSQQQAVPPPAPAALGPPLPEDPAEALQVITNSVALFSEMVAGVPEGEPQGVRDPVIAELADTCGRYRGKLQELAGSVSDEAVLVGVLGQNDALAAAFGRYDELLARALSTPLAPNTHVPVVDTAMRAAAVASAIGVGGAGGAASAGGAPLIGSAGPAFTLLEEGEEEEDDGALATKRQPAPAAAAPVAPAAPAPAPAAPAAGADLGDLLGFGETSHEPAPAAAAAAAAPVPAAAAPAVDDLLGGLTVHSEQPAQPDAAPTDAPTDAADSNPLL
uniref:VHS domain-containing protein n=1 Tax=Chlamydomonas leiostraca TaxID=1034604 RepID=A0A7S0RR98_9CHLO|mmetsp:Transcript_29643/g.75531  ORF Transcript_29643/g.75531 Transcript_29643/m.75531 type:complete len:605 (+) Transcript_29643:60-1874(+)|eukprot:CAMPEP_0202858486 /NCGR_PEP_ID=MMETSP1391-20130828/999_1 /ASSEMBLY_ACC=CAM_ASM_000867 /TAXON_ID=1034604 /ORGANISM="Chlamydomonas leiostraca, Strain SAG 11-49" /LENGTH=604 /DNA_ID=CAMNT_0049537411 /DNA_START=59 /DNA_END=1873 /DNA_ORIENTATION=-